MVWGYIVVAVVERFPVREYTALVAEDRSPEELDKTMKAVRHVLYREILRWLLCFSFSFNLHFSFWRSGSGWDEGSCRFVNVT